MTLLPVLTLGWLQMHLVSLDWERRPTLERAASLTERVFPSAMTPRSSRSTDTGSTHSHIDYLVRGLDRLAAAAAALEGDVTVDRHGTDW